MVRHRDAWGLRAFAQLLLDSLDRGEKAPFLAAGAIQRLEKHGDVAIVGRRGSPHPLCEILAVIA
jgi:hypothetical protein